MFWGNELKNCIAVCLQVEKGVYIPLLIAAGGGGRGYNGNSEGLMELVDHDLSIPGLNGMSGAAGKSTSTNAIIRFLSLNLHTVKKIKKYFWEEENKNIILHMPNSLSPVAR